MKKLIIWIVDLIVLISLSFALSSRFNYILVWISFLLLLCVVLVVHFFMLRLLKVDWRNK